MRALRPIALLALSIETLFWVACRSSGDSPANAIRPVIHANGDHTTFVMRSSPVILLVRIAELNMTGDVRIVDKSPEAGGPSTPTIPLHLARINAYVLLTVRGPVQTRVQFYSWIWASGSHGGPRLFHPDPGAIRVVFLREESGYLHTVGDYPSYDLELSPKWLPALLTAWNSEQQNSADPLERLIALRLRAELEGLSETQLREDLGDDGLRVNHHWVRDMVDLVPLAGPLFVATQLDDICQHSKNLSARFAACFVTAQYFPGRCEALQLARKAAADGFGADYLVKRFESCQARSRDLIYDFRSKTIPPWGFYGSNLAPQHRRETLRVYATAMDPVIQRRACEVAALTPGAGDIPECADRRK